MRKFDASYCTLEKHLSCVPKPDFNNILKVLHRQKPDRPTLFELFLNEPLYGRLAQQDMTNVKDQLERLKIIIRAFRNAGYDYATIHGSDFRFPPYERHKKTTLSLNEGSMISDRRSFEQYPWPDPGDSDYSRLEKLSDELTDGMKLIVMGPGGVLENAIKIVGYENLCFMLIDDPGLTQDIFDAIGSRIVKYYEICVQYDTVGAMISNDDWGFNSQTMISAKDLRKYVIPWHRRIVETIHAAGKPAILHSCGNLEEVMDDIIDDIGFDAKHSYEDNIINVEEAYEKWGDRIAILGGIDVDFVCRSRPEEIYRRSVEMLERTTGRGGYALGTGNSVPTFLPDDNYFAMIAAAKW